MTAFTILTHGNDPPADASVGIPAPPAGPIRRSIPVEPAPGVSEDAGFEEASLPHVVLQLPDLKTSGHWSRSLKFPLATPLYWIVLALGAVLALWLITSGKKPPKQSMSDAPAWSQQNPVHAPSTARTWGGTAPMPRWQANDQETTWNPSQSPSRATQPGPELGQPSVSPSDSPDATAPRDPPYVPTDAVQSGEASGDIRTARGGDTRWDGSSNPVQPGEAAPLGITPSVP